MRTPPDDVWSLDRFDPGPLLGPHAVWHWIVTSLQRLFADYVGLAPSWVIRRFRLHEAAAHATAGGDVDWARLAVTLGYYDQAHMVREFSAAVGTAPARYAAGAERHP